VVAGEGEGGGRRDNRRRWWRFWIIGGRWRLSAVSGGDAPTTLAGAYGGREKVEKKMKMKVKEEEDGDS
jgi:hypothetical protein